MMKLPPTEVAQALKRWVALIVALSILPLGQAELFAQQSYSSPGPYGEPYQQPAYGQQPYYPQRQAYPQQQPYYPQQQAYPQQQPYYPQQQAYPQQQPYYPQQQPYYPQQGYAQPQTGFQPLSAQQLEQVVAPIALYPDSLVAEVLAASTYPQEVAQADQWRRAQGYAPAEQIAAAVYAQNWDPSVKGLTAFPQVLELMDGNLRWTADLGNAYYNQPQDVLQAVQEMRQRAQAAGNLQNTPQETVSYEQGNIEVAPANPQVVYVPAFNPWAVYGEPVSPYPGFSLLGALGSFLGSNPVSFGLGIAISAFSHTTFGLLGWGLSWVANAIFFNHSPYYSHSTTVADWGFAAGGRRPFTSHAFNRGSGGYGQSRNYNSGYARGSSRGYPSIRPAAGYGRPVQQAYNHMQPAVTTAYRRPNYASSFAGGGSYGFANRESAQRFSNHTFSGYKQPSRGFHLFGGGHSQKSFGGGKGFGGGHSGGGGHGFGKHHH